MTSKTATFEYLQREITVEYYTEDSRIYIEGIDFNGRDVTELLDHNKIYQDLPEAIYQESVYGDEKYLDL